MSKYKDINVKLAVSPGERTATLRSALIGAGGVLLVTLAVLIFNPKVLRRPPPPPAPTLVQGQVTAPSSTPLDQAVPAAAGQDAPAAPESPPASSQAFASVSPAAVEAVGGTAEEASASGQTAEIPAKPALRPHTVHPVRQLKKAVVHRVRHVAPAAPAVAGADLPAVVLEPPPPPAVERQPGVVVGSRRHPDDVLSKVVSLADLNLATDVGACKALSRIRRAAEDVCPFDGERQLGVMRERKMCVQESIDRAVQDIHARRVEVLQETPHGC